MPDPTRGSVFEVCAAFLKLGLTSFGGPIAHLGYFHREIVVRRRWIDEAHYAQLIALCQFLPGPGSSQLGFSLGLLRAGWAGAIVAFLAFTLPSVVLLLAFARLIPLLEQPYGQAALHGLKLLAVAVVAHGVVTMAQRLTPDLSRRCIALVAGIACIVSSTAVVQIIVVTAGAIAGVLLCRNGRVHETVSFNVAYGVRTGAVLLALFAAVLAIALLLPATASPLLSVAAAFCRAGALVFGGGHVVLPLLQEGIVSPGWVDPEEFLAGYGAAQAVPGPMFAFAAFLGARIHGAGGAVGALVSLIAIFLPGLLLVAGALPLWRSIASGEKAARAIAGINASVVGLLAAALYDPVWKMSVHDGWDVVIALTGFGLLIATRLPVLIVLAGCVLAAVVRQGLTV
ncbi:chromate efflux transporter [Povalibacter sp.]|uniref:chromate efflux transporter n=1 Tax=Povalibacter sp. TaxID=1962978 RepID=UPI002F410FE6